MSNETPRRLLIVALFMFSTALLCGAAWQAWDGSTRANATAAQIAASLQAERRIEAVTEELVELLTLGLYSGHSDSLRALGALSETMVRQQSGADAASVVFVAVAALWLALLWALTRSRNSVAYGLLWVSAIALVVGLLAPMLSIVAHKELPVLGYTVIKADSKAILDTAFTLMDRGNTLPAVLILLFSVGFPVLKLLALFVHYVERWRHITIHGVNFVQHLGKWSMADVFVVALLVTYMGSGASGDMEASLQTGLYFFVAYVLLSMAGGVMLQAGEGVRTEDRAIRTKD
ncbi:MAG: paraquat-inducible protein A [Gammaproteobacteria bacterium]